MSHIELHPTATTAPTPERRQPSEHDAFLDALRTQEAIIDEQAATEVAERGERDGRS